MKDFRKGNAFDLMRKQIEKEITKLSKLRKMEGRKYNIYYVEWKTDFNDYI